jgi:NADH dehydrogenase
LRQNSPSEALAEQGRATSAAALIAAGAQPVYGDLKEPGSLEAAVAGVATVITTANSAARSGEDNPQTVDLGGTRALIEAASAAGVKQFIYTSASTADADSPVPFLAAKGQSERSCMDSGMTYTIVAPHIFMEIWLGMVVIGPALSGQPVTLVGSGDRRHSFIATEDVADFIVAAVDNPRAANQRLVLGGPEAFSYRDAAAVVGKVSGRPVPVNNVAPGQPLPGLPDFLAANLAAQDTYDMPIEMEQLSVDYGISLTSFESVVRNMIVA